MRLHVGWVINRIPYCSSDGCVWLGIGYGVGRLAVGSRIEEDSFSTIDSCTYMLASRSSTHGIDNACMFGIASEHVCKRGVVTCVTLFIVYSFSCDFFIASCVKTHNLHSKEFPIQNPTYGNIMARMDAYMYLGYTCNLHGRRHNLQWGGGA